MRAPRQRPAVRHAGAAGGQGPGPRSGHRPARRPGRARRSRRGGRRPHRHRRDGAGGGRRHRRRRGAGLVGERHGRAWQGRARPARRAGSAGPGLVVAGTARPRARARAGGGRRPLHRRLPAAGARRGHGARHRRPARGAGPHPAPGVGHPARRLLARRALALGTAPRGASRRARRARAGRRRPRRGARRRAAGRRPARRRAVVHRPAGPGASGRHGRRPLRAGRAPGADRARRRRGRPRGRAAALPRGPRRPRADLRRAPARRPGLVRPRRVRARRRRGGAVRHALHRTGQGPHAPRAAQRAVVPAAGRPVRRAHRPDRGVPRAAGGARAHAASEPARHECMGPDRAGRRRRGPCPGLAGARPGCRAGAVPGRAPAPGRGHRDDAPLPAGGVRLARDAVRERPRGRARRRHGSGQDSADTRARTARARPEPRRPAVPRGGAHQRRRHLAQRGGPVHARPAGGDGDGHVPHPRRNHDRRAREHRGRRRDVVRAVQARAPSLPGGRAGRGWCSTRRRT